MFTAYVNVALDERNHWTAAIELAEQSKDLFERMAILSAGARAHLEANYLGLPDTPHTHAQINATKAAMAREIIVRGLLNQHGER